MSSYYSFLVCAHPEHVDLYYCGMPLGSITAHGFELHQFLNSATGTRRPLTLDDLPHPCPFETVEELKTALREFVGAIQLPPHGTATVPAVP